MEDGGDGDGIGQETGGLAEGTFVVERTVVPRVEISVPVGHVDHGLFNRWAWVLEFGEEPAGSEVVVIFIDLAETVTYL